MQPQVFDDLKPGVVLAIGAHPDDMDFGAAGTLNTFAKQGAKIHYLQLTDGGSGSADPDTTRQSLIDTRKAEQRSACRAIGGQDVTFLDYPDGQLENTLELKVDIVRVIRQLKPDMVITMDPTMVYAPTYGIINHPDHRAAGQAALDAVYPLARDHLSLPRLLEEGYRPHKVTTVLLINFETSNYDIDVSACADCKEAAIRAHASQLVDPDAMVDMFMGVARQRGAAAGFELAESFIRLDIPA